MTSEYIYAEPEAVQATVYMDATDKPHLTREDAIAASIVHDIERHLRGELARAWPDDHEERAYIARQIARQIGSRQNRILRQMVRDLIEATD
jgi:hypothetical protein